MQTNIVYGFLEIDERMLLQKTNVLNTGLPVEPDRGPDRFEPVEPVEPAGSTGKKVGFFF